MQYPRETIEKVLFTLIEIESSSNVSLAFAHLVEAATTLCPFLIDGWEGLLAEQKHVIADLSPDLLSIETSVDKTSVMNEMNIVCTT